MWYNGYMIATPYNLYRMTTDTTIPNSGIGNNALTKPAGVTVASIVPDKRESVHVTGPLVFTTDFDVDVDGFTVLFYAMPESGRVLEIDGITVDSKGYSFVLSNVSGESVEIPVRSRRSRVFVFMQTLDEAALSIDGRTVTIPNSVTTDPGPAEITLLEAGGLVDMVSAYPYALEGSDIEGIVSGYLTPRFPHDSTVMLNDDHIQHSASRTVVDSLTLEPGQIEEILLRSNDCIAFKVEYLLTGDADVYVNGEPFESGMTLQGTPDAVVVSSNGCTIEDLVVTEYYSTGVEPAGPAEVSTDQGVGTPAPLHTHDRWSGAQGTTTITVEDDPAQHISGWFYAQDGEVLPGVSMADGVLTGTDLMVNGTEYSGEVLQGWYFLSVNAEFAGAVEVNAPVYSLTVSEDPLSPVEIDDLYESFFGNPKASAGTEQISVIEKPAFIISTEWSIVSSG